MPEGDEASSRRLPPEDEGDTLAERRARRAWLGDAALLRRAEAAEASVRTLEAHLADLRLRQAESEREREHTTAQLAERELELRRVKQREYAEQQLRVEAEEVAARARRGHRTELDRWQRRVEAAEAAAQHAEAQRDALTARLAGVNESCERLRDGILALQGVAAELRATFERDHRLAQTRIRELEGALERARARPLEPQRYKAEESQRSEAEESQRSKTGEPQRSEAEEPRRSEAEEPRRSEAEEAQRREEMAEALAAAVARLRTRVALAPESQGEEQPSAAALATRSPERTAAAAFERPAAATPQPPAAATPEPSETVSTSSAQPGSSRVSTVIVVPRLFPGHGRSARRLAPAVRRVAVRLAKWADRAQAPQR
jgi:hypothetical protein